MKSQSKSLIYYIEDIKRGEKNMFTLIWNNEIIESEINSREEAEYLKAEYSIAFKSNNIQIVSHWG